MATSKRATGPREALEPETPLGTTLDAFAGGAEVPGSGSANALGAALAAALTTSVARKTLTSDRLQYRTVGQLATDTVRRCERARGELQELAARDMEVFAPVIAFRREARTAVEKYKQDQAHRREIDALKPATELPLRIAELALEIGTMATAMLRQGFQPARGESYTALTLAITAVDGALFVARVNVTTIRQRILRLNDPELERHWLDRTTRKLRQLRVTSRSIRTHEIGFRRASELSLSNAKTKATKTAPVRRRRSSSR